MRYTWLIEYYGENGIIKRKYVDARTRRDALSQVNDFVIELICCIRVDRW